MNVNLCVFELIFFRTFQRQQVHRASYGPADAV